MLLPNPLIVHLSSLNSFINFGRTAITMGIIKLSRTERHRLSIFITCLVIAAVFWLFFALSNKYIYQTYTKIEYKNLPQNKAFYPLQQDTISMQVEGSGWQLLFSRIPLTFPYIEIDLHSLNKQNYVVLSQQLSYINRQLESQRVISVAPDTLFFDFSTRSVKKVPVELLYNLEFKKPYGISAPVRIFPSEVTVSGPEGEISNIETWATDSLKLKNLTGPVHQVVALSPSSKANIDTYPSRVEVEIPVEEFTEKVLEIPIRVINNDRYDVKLLPGRIKLTVLASLSAYPQLTKESFEAVVDLEKWKKKSYTQLPIKLTHVPPFCTVVKQEPQAVDFIIQE